MEQRTIKTKKILLGVILFLLICPLIQNKLQLLSLEPLKGDIRKPERSQFSLSRWFSGDYQIGQEKYLNETFGFRSTMVRVNNQLAYNVFNEAKANGVIIGKDNYLFEINYIKAYYGTDFIGAVSIRERMKQLKFVQDTLAKMNKTLLLVFAPGKASFYPEYIPRKYHRERTTTNIQFFSKMADSLDVNYIDFNKYFILNKNKAEYPLYPKYGIHWSFYGTCLAADSMIKKLEFLRHTDLHGFTLGEMNVEESKEMDYDLADGMNLLFKLKSKKMAYPLLYFEVDSTKPRLNSMVVSDSYYWLMFNNSFSRTFGENEFWYYNRLIYRANHTEIRDATTANLTEEIAKNDVIVILCTEANLTRLGWGFIQQAYNLYSGQAPVPVIEEEFPLKVKNLADYIKSNPDWRKSVEAKAAAKGISIDSVAVEDAIYQIRHER